MEEMRLECARMKRKLFNVLRGKSGPGDAGKTSGATTPPGKPRPGDDAVRKLSERYVDRGQVGRGGMSTVRRVLDKGLLRETALKRLDPELAMHALRVQRFREEAQITGQLDHPNIVPIHEIGEDDEGAHYFSMKLVQGSDLERALAEAGEQRLAPDRLIEFLKILIKVCEAVAFAHSRGVIHRDLKPSNIMVGEFGQVYLMDWGVARLLDAPDGGDAETARPLVRISRSRDSTDIDPPGTIVGSPSYMAPEQVEGAHEKIDQRTDIFALGATLYQILTGRAPYMEDNYYKLLVKALCCEVSTPEEVVGPNKVPPRLAEIAMKAMAAVPEDRYASVVELQRELEQFLRGEWHLPTRTFPPGAVIVREGEEGDTAYIITSGECVVTKRSGDEHVELRRLGPGDVFGETAIFSAQVRSATVEAVDEVVVMVVDHDALTSGLGLSSWAGRFVKTLAERFREVDDRLRRLEAAQDEP